MMVSICVDQRGDGGERTIKALLFTPLDITHSFTRNTHTHTREQKDATTHGTETIRVVAVAQRAAVRNR